MPWARCVLYPTIELWCPQVLCCCAGLGFYECLPQLDSGSLVNCVFRLAAPWSGDLSDLRAALLGESKALDRYDCSPANSPLCPSCYGAMLLVVFCVGLLGASSHRRNSTLADFVFRSALPAIAGTGLFLFL